MKMDSVLASKNRRSFSHHALSDIRDNHSKDLSKNKNPNETNLMLDENIFKTVQDENNKEYKEKVEGVLESGKNNIVNIKINSIMNLKTLQNVGVQEKVNEKVPSINNEDLLNEN